MQRSLETASAFERNPRRRQELIMRPAINRIYRDVFGDVLINRQDDDEIRTVLDKYHAIDVEIVLPSGNILLGQEKALSYRFRDYASLTVEYEQNQHTGEQGDWFKLASQIYFTGYATVTEVEFDPWILVNWTALVLATKAGVIPWRDNENKDGRARASFRYVRFADLPSEVIISRS